MTNLASQLGIGEPPELNIDPFVPDTITNPYSFYEMLREAAPIVSNNIYGFYAIGRYEESKTVLSDYKRFMTSAGTGMQDIRKGGEFRIPNPLLENDPPVHTKLRSVMTKLLSPLVIRGWRDHFEMEANAMVDELMDKGDFDGVDLVESYISRVFPAAVGVKLRREAALAIGNMRLNQPGPKNELYHESMKNAQPYLDWYEQAIRRENMIPGSIGEMVYDAEERGELDQGIAAGMVRVFVGGGLDTTVSTICFTLMHLALNPGQWAIIRKDPTKVRGAIDETLRIDPPSYLTFRTTINEMEFCGYHLERDSKVGVFIGAANRDPRKWDLPGNYNVLRDTAGIHLGFSTGVHTCIGQMIARFEGESIIRAIATRAKALELAGPIRHRPINILRALDHLPLRIVAA